MSDVHKDFETPLGKTWRPRRDAADAVHRKKSAKWDYLRALYLNAFDGIPNITWNDTIAIGWSIVSQMVEDTYFQDPESNLIPRANDANGDLTKEINDVTNTIHKDADTEGIVKQGMQACAFAGFGIHWAYHEQLDRDADTGIVVDRQRVLGDYVSPWDFRGDPAGRRWDFKDFKWITRRFTRSLGFLSRMPGAVNIDKLREWSKTQRQQKNTDIELAERVEEDEDHIDIELEETWDRTKRRTYVFPVDADFHIRDEAWPWYFVDADDLPSTLIAFNKVPEDRKRIDGWWPKPDLELVEDSLEELNRLNGLLMQAATLSTLKYLYIKGLISDEEWAKLRTTDSLIGIPVDLTKVKEHLQAAGLLSISGDLDLKKLVVLLPQEERAAMIKHEEAIVRVLNNISEVLGQGPNARYGVSPDRTATGIAAMEAKRDTRAKARANTAGRFYNSITAKFWLLLKAHQQLPVDYMYATDGDRGLWRQFDTKKVRNIDLVYRHKMGSSRPRDTQGELFAQKELASISLPFLQSAGQFDAGLEIIKDMYRTQGLKDLSIFSSTARELAKQLAVLQHKVMSDPTGEIAANPETAHARAELTTQLLTAILGAKGMQEVAAMITDAGEGGEPPDDGGAGGMGTPPGTPTAGEQQFRAGAMAAGASNVGG